jgi:hypothetical protein
MVMMIMIKIEPNTGYSGSGRGMMEMQKMALLRMNIKRTHIN